MEFTRFDRSWRDRVLVDVYSVGRGRSLLDLRVSGKCSFFAEMSSTDVNDLYSV